MCDPSPGSDCPAGSEKLVVLVDTDRSLSWVEPDTLLSVLARVKEDMRVVMLMLELRLSSPPLLSVNRLERRLMFCWS